MWQPKNYLLIRDPCLRKRLTPLLSVFMTEMRVVPIKGVAAILTVQLWLKWDTAERVRNESIIS